MLKSIIITLVFFILPLLAAANKTVVSIPYNNHFRPLVTQEGETLSISAFAADSIFFYLYDMSDRSLAILDSSGIFVKKIPFQNIGRRTYIGDDFIITDNKAVFLNTVDYRLEYFNIQSGVLIKSISCPKEIPGNAKQRRFRKITRIFLDNDQIYLGNAHAVFPFFEDVNLMKKSDSKVIHFKSEKSLLFYNSKTPVQLSSGKLECAEYSMPFKHSGRPFYGKHTSLVNKSIFVCTVNNTGITISRVNLTE